MQIFLAFLTYFSYAFIVSFYLVKLLYYLRMPIHLRWELYPVILEKNKYGGSYMESPNFWEKEQKRDFMKGILYLLKEYFILSEYFNREKAYWLFLYPWHIGFITIILFHISCFFSALLMVYGWDISPSSESPVGLPFYYISLFLAILSFITGLFGGIGLFIRRLKNKDLRLYASPMNFFTYFFTILVFGSGLYAFFFDPTLLEYREFWKGLLNFNFIHVSKETALHIFLFSLFLIYLPFTRSIHYITRLFGFFLIRWDDKPNLRKGDLEERIEKQLNFPINWAAPHIKGGKSWKENAAEIV